MSNGFKEREKAFEEKWAHDESLRFKVEARRDKLVGLWAAGEMGLITGAEAEAYANSVVEADMTEAGDEDVFRKIRADFDAKNIARSDHLIRSKLDRTSGRRQRTGHARDEVAIGTSRTAPASISGTSIPGSVPSPVTS